MSKKISTLALCFLLGATIPSFANTIANPTNPTPPTVNPGAGDTGTGGVVSNPGSSFGSSYSDHKFRSVFETSIMLTQPIWKGGATSAQIAMQKARLGSANYLFEDAAASLAFEAITCHIDVLRRRSMVQLAHENVLDHEKMLATLQERVDDGLASIGDVYQVQSRLARARGSLSEYQSYLKATEATFLRITGKRAPKNMAPVTMPIIQYSSPQQIATTTESQHPRIKAILAEIDAYEEEKNIATSQFLPQVGLEAGPRWYFQDTERDRTNHGFDAMLVMNWNLYEGGRTVSEKEIAKAHKRQTKKLLHSTRDIFAEDIESTWVKYIAAQEQAMFYEEAMNAAKAARTAFYEQYLLGTRNLLDVLDAENDYFQSASQHMIAQGDINIAVWRLLTLSGDILKELHINAASLLSSQKTHDTSHKGESNLSKAASDWDFYQQ